MSAQSTRRKAVAVEGVEFSKACSSYPSPSPSSRGKRQKPRANYLDRPRCVHEIHPAWDADFYGLVEDPDFADGGEA